MTPEEKNLIAQIEAAFKGVEREDGITLHQALADDDWLPEEEQLKARQLDAEERWEDIPDEILKDEGSFFSFLDAKGLRYYLPVSMRCALRHSGGYLTDTILYNFYPISPEQGDPADFVANVVKNLQLTKEQCGVIYEFMKYSQDEFLEADERWVKSLEAWKAISN